MEPLLIVASGLLIFMLSLNTWERFEARRRPHKPKRKNQPPESASISVLRVLLMERCFECMAQNTWAQARDHALAGAGILPPAVLHGLVAETYLAERDMPGTMRHLTIVLHETPSDAVCRALLGLCHAYNSEAELALACLEPVSDKHPLVARLALRHQVAVLLLCQRPDDAIRYADRAIKQYRRGQAGTHERHFALGLLLLMRGQACFFSGRDDEALRDLQQARAFAHTCDAALLSLLAFHYGANNLEIAHALFTVLTTRNTMTQQQKPDVTPELPGILRTLADQAFHRFSRDDFVPSQRRL
jgi:tetratricopeptide (TPR) repeat protein